MEKESGETKKTKKPYRIHPMWKWVLFAVVVVYCVITILTQQAQLNEQKKISDDLAAQEEELQKKVESLENELAYMDSDEYVERTARDRLGMIKDGEIIFEDEDMRDPDDAEKEAEEK